MATPKTARWLDLLAFLLQHRLPVTREQIFAKVAGYREPATPNAAGRGATAHPPGRSPAHPPTPPSAHESPRRKFERDKDDLRRLGIDIETVEIPDAEGDEPQLGYRLRPGGFYLPYFELVEESAPRGPAQRGRPYHGLAEVGLTRDELTLLDRATRRLAERTEFPLARAAASARRKLAFDLPLSEAAVERVLAFPLSESGRAALATLQEAAASRTAVACRYYSIGRDAEEDREIEPWGLFFQWSHWYCVGRARDRDALRVFRVDRVRAATKLTGDAARFAVPPEFDVRRYLGRAPWELSDAPPTAVRVEFRFPESRWVLNQGVGRPVEPMLADGGATLEFGVRDRPPFLRWLLTFRNQAQVLAPAAVGRELDALRQQVRAIYGE